MLTLDPFPEELLNARKSMGCHQRAFVFSFYYLLRYAEYQKPENSSKNIYFDAMRQIVKEGGDTDTNAAIAGGMIGALVGLKNIPKDMSDKVFNFDCSQ